MKDFRFCLVLEEIKKPISQMVRHKILILVFTGSNPVWAI